MCGRFTLRTPLTVLIEHFDLSLRDERQLPLFKPRYNVAPTQDVAIVRLDAKGARELVLVRWGIVPPWAKQPGEGPSLINARAESVADKAAFRAALRRRRCLVPADGFYEWQQLPGDARRRKKQPYFIHRPDERVFAFAGLWEAWSPAGSQAAAIESCAIITRPADPNLAPIHDRTPVVLAPDDYQPWLDASIEDPAKIAQVLEPSGQEDLIAEPVGKHVNSVANDDSQCIAVERTLFE